ncbi:Bud-site selection protein [Xylariaceae sp. FL0016]|nr:Bud-site selection protein [Xylariaceae sp. FL0016]
MGSLIDKAQELQSPTKISLAKSNARFQHSAINHNTGGGSKRSAEMPKRKRGEPSLDDKIAQWNKELVRGLKTAKGFERQRQSKRLREAANEGNEEKKLRLEREGMVLKSLDLHAAAHAHLCSSLLKIKGIAESPKLPAEIKPVPKPELTEEEKTALHNVTSALCNRKQVKDVIDEAVMGTCIALRVPMPDKKTKGKGKKEGSERAQKEEQADDRKKSSESKVETKAQMAESEDSNTDEIDEQEDFEEPILLRRKAEKAGGVSDLEDEDDAGSESSESPDFEGFSDDEAEERMFLRYDDFVAGSSDEDEGESDDGSQHESDEEHEDSRAKAIRKVAVDDLAFSEASAESQQSEDSEDSEASAVLPPPKKAKTRAVRAEPIKPGTSAFLPTLMGGYISGSESASDVDVAPARKNRRGQRARQAIWEKKYGEKAKHRENQAQKQTRDQGWDLKRGAVEPGEATKPWKQGVKDPFEKSHVHPERQRQMQKEETRPQAENSKNWSNGQKGLNRAQRREQAKAQGHLQITENKPKPPPGRDDAGTLHPSWAAAKKAKEQSEKVAFLGKKVVFD